MTGMVRAPRKLFGVLLLLVILGNVWYLGKKHAPQDLGSLYAPAGSQPGGDAGSAYAGPPVDEEPERPLSGGGPKKVPPYGTKSYTTKAAVATDKPAAGGAKGGDAHAPKAGSDTKAGSGDTKAGSGDTKASSGDAKGADAYGLKDAPAGGFDAYKSGMEAIQRVLDQIAELNPGVGPLKSYNRDIKGDTDLMDKGHMPPTSTVLGMYLQLNDDDVSKIKYFHEKVMELLPSQTVPKAFTGRGVVMTGGGKYFPMVLTAIKWLREVNKDIPIEVFMADNTEYEEKFCDDLFPKLKTSCRVIEQIYGKQLSAKLDSKYALKPLAILASRFDDMYFMDADSLPLYDFEPVFDSRLYADTGMILNGDYWPRYIHPRFYDIVGRKLGGRARGSPSSDALLQADREGAVPGKSTESGQVFVSKSRHIKSLLLSMYYNLFGPDVFFPLIMQNGHGEGDKDTYAAAATIVDEPFYQTQRRPVTLGLHMPEGYKGYAMVQPDPLTDYARLVEKNEAVPERFFALHANSIKANAKYMLQNHDETVRGHPPLRKMRYFGNLDNIEREIHAREDIELRMFNAMTSVTCDWALKDGYIPRDWETEDAGRLCRLLKQHVKWLAAHPDSFGAPENNGGYEIDEQE